MKDNENNIRRVEEISRGLANVFEGMGTIPGMYDIRMEKSEALCRAIPEQIASGIVRIAVVGVIKSGKTTFVNSMLGSDMLKRGAGLATSIVTRVRKGEGPRARIMFKSWDEINREIAEALMFLPDMKLPGPPDLENNETSTFDLRRKRDRELLKAAALGLHSSLSVTEKGIRPESLIISQAVEGYDAVKDYVQADPAVATFGPGEFERHRDFTGNAANALFVRDVLLEIPGDSAISSHAEMADCQGSDSTVPSHTLHIQEYLNFANLLIYIISSRTGLREADLRFLNQIRSMGLLDNVIFVVNADIGEHENLAELRELEKSIAQGVGYFVENPRIHTFPALLSLFEDTLSSLTARDGARLSQWKREREIFEYCRTRGSDFKSDLDDLIERNYRNVILKNHVHRLKTLSIDAKRRSRVFKELLSSDIERARDTVKRLHELQAGSKQFEARMDESVENTVKRLKKSISRAIHKFFDPYADGHAMEARRFILNYHIYDDKYDKVAVESGFANALYNMFQDFRVAVDRFIATGFAPGAAGFIRIQEKAMEDAFQNIDSLLPQENPDICNINSWYYFKESYFKESYSKESYFKESGTGVQKHEKTSPLEINTVPDISGTGVNLHERRPATPDHGNNVSISTVKDREKLSPLDINAVKRILGVEAPTILFSCSYGSGIKADALARLCFYTAMGALGKVLNLFTKPANATSLKEASKKIRRDALLSLGAFLKNYGHRLEKDYFDPLIEAVARDSKEKIANLLYINQVDGDKLQHLISADTVEKSRNMEHLEELERDIDGWDRDIRLLESGKISASLLKP
ncbi:MAG: dynamin family protein [Desulfamplus sp.]|nr:dynamin family protein [Desulfamplus sp.]